MMQLQIDKQVNGNVRIEVQTDTGRKPIVVELTPAQVETLIPLLKGAVAADRFHFKLAL